MLAEPVLPSRACSICQGFFDATLSNQPPEGEAHTLLPHYMMIPVMSASMVWKEEMRVRKPLLDLSDWPCLTNIFLFLIGIRPWILFNFQSSATFFISGKTDISQLAWPDFLILLDTGCESTFLPVLFHQQRTDYDPPSHTFVASDVFLKKSGNEWHQYVKLVIKALPKRARIIFSVLMGEKYGVNRVNQELWKCPQIEPKEKAMFCLIVVMNIGTRTPNANYEIGLPWDHFFYSQERATIMSMTNQLALARTDNGGIQPSSHFIRKNARSATKRRDDDFILFWIIPRFIAHQTRYNILWRNLSLRDFKLIVWLLEREIVN